MAENTAPDPDAYDPVNNPGGKRPDSGDEQPATTQEQDKPAGQPVEPNTTRNTPGLTEPSQTRRR